MQLLQALIAASISCKVAFWETGEVAFLKGYWHYGTLAEIHRNYINDK